MLKKVLTPVLVALASLALIGTGAFASWLWSQSNSASVTISGSGAALFKDAACTIPLLSTDPLSFASVHSTSPSNNITIYLKNVGTDPFRPTISETGIDSLLALNEATYGVIGATDVYLAPAPVDHFLNPGNVVPVNLQISAVGDISGKIGTVNNFVISIKATN